MKSRSLIESFNFAIDGLIYVIRTQRNMKIHFAAAAAVLGLALLLRLETWAFVALVFAAMLVIVAEMINTAIEAAIDLVATAYDPIAEIAKDVAAGAVLLASINAVIIGYLVFSAKLNQINLTVIQRVSQSPSHLTLITLLLVLIVVVAAKAWTGSGSALKGGWPSGHSALAGSLFTAISFISQSPVVAMLGLGLALLVFHSRKEAGIHTTLEIVSGGIIGILVTIFVFQVFYV